MQELFQANLDTLIAKDLHRMKLAIIHPSSLPLTVNARKKMVEVAWLMLDVFISCLHRFEV